jgi:hypothetical protein
MSVDKLVDSTQLDADLTDVADEIRTAGGTLLPLSFPDDYVVAIGDIGNTEIKTASGSIAHFEDSLARKAQDLTVAIDPVQSGSGDPSPDNVRPISGWTGAEVTRTGANVWHEEWEAGSIDSSTGENMATAGIIRTKNYIPVLPDTKYFAHFGNYPDGNVKTRFYDSSKNYIGYMQKSNTAVAPNNPFVIPTNAYYLRFQFANTYGTTYNNDISINYPATDTAYHAYQGETYIIDLGGTRYGGTLDMTTGKLTVTHGQIASYAGEALPGEWISDRDVYSAGATPTTGAQVVYKLATPIVYDLDPVTVTTLLGTNNVWADTGDSTIKYIAPKAQIPSAQGVYF